MLVDSHVYIRRYLSITQPRVILITHQAGITGIGRQPRIHLVWITVVIVVDLVGRQSCIPGIYVDI